MGITTKPSLKLIAKANSLNSANALLTTTRASTATRINSYGIIESIVANELRFNYDPTYLTESGWLVEEPRTNLCLQSEDFSTTWTASGGQTVTTNTTETLAPDGTNTAEKIEWTTNADSRRQNITVGADASVYTNSIFVKNVDATRIALQLNLAGGTAIDVYAILEIVDGSITALGASDRLSVTEFPNGWYRITITDTNNSTNTSIRIAVFPVTAGNAIDTKTIYVWGAQVEVGGFATSYIPTTTVAVTRSADVATVAVSGFDFNSSEGTFFIEASTKETGANNTGLIGWSDGTSTNRAVIYLPQANSVQYTGIATTQQWALNIANTTPVDNGFHKLTFSYKNSDFSVVGDAGTPATASSGNVIPGVTQVEIGFAQGVSYLNGHIKQVAYFPRRLTNSELIELTK